MCGRFASQLPPEEIARLFSTAGDLPNLGPNWNVAPTQPAMVVRRHPETGERRLDVLRWGLVPHFTKDLKKCTRPINARAETVATSGMFRGALVSRRCIVPADAFYEWKAMADGKQPYAIARTDGAPLAFAGLWEGWRSPDGETLRTFTIVTTEANADMARLHSRMPVILERDAWPVWLGEAAGDAPALLRPAADGVVKLWPVSRAVNSVRNNGAALLDCIDDPAAPPPSDAPAGQNST
jgi:putative SOS response-associated peptidase YedK